MYTINISRYEMLFVSVKCAAANFHFMMHLKKYLSVKIDDKFLRIVFFTN